MNLTGQRIAQILILTSIAFLLLGCAGLFTTTPAPGLAIATPTPGNIEALNPAYAIAQATIDAGQGQLSNLSRKATEVSLNMTQAANAVAQSTQDYNQRQKLDLDFQATAVSLNIAQAAATQQFIKRQTKMAGDATAAAQSSAAAAAQSAYWVNVTQTAQGRVVLAAQVLHTDQAMAALTTYPLTATPFAVTQAALLMQEYGREQQSFVDRVVNPLIPIVATLLLVLSIVVIILAYRRYMHIAWPRHLLTGRANINPNPLMIIDGVAADHDPQFPRYIPYELTPANPPRLSGENKPHVEIVDASEPPVAHWIAEVEFQLSAEGGLYR